MSLTVRADITKQYRNCPLNHILWLCNTLLQVIPPSVHVFVIVPFYLYHPLLTEHLHEPELFISQDKLFHL